MRTSSEEEYAAVITRARSRRRASRAAGEAGLDEAEAREVLSSGEQQLLGEWLDRMASAES